MADSLAILQKTTKQLQATASELSNKVKSIGSPGSFGPITDRLELLVQSSTQQNTALGTISNYLSKLESIQTSKSAKDSGGGDSKNYLSIIHDDLSELNANVLKGITILSSTASALGGGVGMMPNLKSLANDDKLDSLISKLAPILERSKKENMKDANESKSGGETSGAPVNTPKVTGSDEFTQAVGSFIDNIKKLSDLQTNGTIINASAALDVLSNMDISKSINMFLLPLVKDPTIAGLSEDPNAAQRSQLMAEIFNESKKVGTSKENANKKAALEAQLNSLPKTTSGSQVVATINSLVGIMSKFSEVGKIGLWGLIKARVLGKIGSGMGKSIGQFINNLLAGNWVQKVTAAPTNDDITYLLLNKQIAELTKKDPTGDNVSIQKEIGKLQELRDKSLQKSSNSDSIVAVLSKSMEILKQVGELGSGGVKNYWKLKTLASLDYGSQINKILVQLATGLQQAVEPSLNAGLDAMSKINGAIEGFYKDIWKNLGRLAILNSLRPGYFIGMFLRGLSFDMTKGIDIPYWEGEAGKLKTPPPKLKDGETPQPINSPKGLEAWSVVLNYQLDTASGVVESAYGLAQDVSKKLPAFIKLGLFGSFIGFGLLKLIASLSIAVRGKPGLKIGGITLGDKAGILGMFGSNPNEVINAFVNLSKVVNILAIIQWDKLNKVSGSLKKAEKFVEGLSKQGGVIDQLVIIKHKLDQMVGDKSVTGIQSSGVGIAIQFIEGLGKVIKGLAMSSFLIPLAWISVIFIFGIIKLFSVLGNPLTGRMTRKGMNVLRWMSFSMLALVAGAILSGFLAIKFTKFLVAGILVIMGIVGLFSLLGSPLGAIITKKGVKSLRGMAFGMLLLVLAAVVVGVLVLKYTKEVLIGLTTIFAVLFIFMMLGKLDKPIKDGAKSLLIISLGMIVFAIGMLLLAKVIQANPISSVLGIALMLATAVGVAFIGKLPGLKKGAKSLILISAALVIFAVGLGLMNIALIGMTWEKLAMAGAVFAVLGGAAALIGFLDKSGAVKQGAIALILIGGALVVFSVGLAILNLALIGLTWKKLGMAGAVFGVLTVAAGALGAIIMTGVGGAALFLGIAAIAAIGVALIPLATGLLLLGMVKPWDKKQSKSFKFMLAAIGEGFLSVVLNDWGLPSPSKIAGLAAAIPLTLLMSVALITLGLGLGVMNKVIKDFDFSTSGYEDGKPIWSSKSIPFKIKSVITAVSSAFGAVGAATRGKDGLGYSWFDVLKGVKATEDMGGSMIGIAQGMKEFQNIEGIIGGSIENLQKNVVSIITAISKAFAEVGKMNGGVDFLGFSIVAGDVEKGVKATKGMGRTLKDIAVGVKEFQNLKNLGMTSSDFDPENGEGLVANIVKIITAVSSAFAKIGKVGKFYDRPGGRKIWIADESVQRGVEATEGMGSIVADLAKGVKAFGELKYTENGKTVQLDLKQIGINIEAVITTISEVFRKLGQKGSKGSDGKWYPSQSVQRGVEAMQGTGTELNQIAQSLVPFMNLQSGIMINGKRVPIKMDVLKSNIQEIVGMSLNIVTAIGSTDAGFRSKWLPDSPAEGYKKETLQAGADVMKQVGESLKPMQDIMKIIGSIDQKKLGQGSPLGQLSTDLSQWFVSITKGITPEVVDKANQYLSIVKQLANVADPFDKFSKANVQFTKDFDSQIKAINSIKVDKIKEVINLNKIMNELMKLDKNVFQENIKLLQQYMWAIKDAAESNVDSLKAVMEQIAAVVKESITGIAQAEAGANNSGGGKGGESRGEDSNKQNLTGLAGIQKALNDLNSKFSLGTAKVEVKSDTVVKLGSG